jgi:xylulose-5-phosphate/fructose-6-phosphate phosphoketolase
MTAATLDTESPRRIDAYWRAANYRWVGQIHLYDNPLLKRPPRSVIGTGTRFTRR